MADTERTARIVAELAEAQLDGVLCALPMNVLMLSGYWPVVGTGAAICTRDGQVLIAAPQAEYEFAAAAQPHRLELFSPASLSSLDRLPIREALCKLLRTTARLRIGVEEDSATVPVGYSALHFYADDLRKRLTRDLKHSAVPADAMLRRLRSVKTSRELEMIRAACDVASHAFMHARSCISPGKSEMEIACEARREFSLPAGNQGHHRADGFAWCMSGPNSSEAGAAFARSQSRKIEDGEVVLLHANSYFDGYWTDLTRTFIASEPSAEIRRLLLVISQAREAALAAMRPGIAAKTVDAAARNVIASHGFAENFSHGLGHEVGFGAISANELPRIHPASTDVLESGMVFNIEPAIYVPGRFGLRHCDMVHVREGGPEVLTPWLSAA